MSRAVVFATLLLHASLALASPLVEGQANALEQRILAPCCWTQTLDVHESPLVTEMRIEIRQRLAAGESAQSIEDSFAQRHGERVRAMPRGKDPLVTFAQCTILALAVSAFALFLIARRWRTRRPSVTHAADPIDAELDATLDRAIADPRQ